MKSLDKKIMTIEGQVDGHRVSSRDMEEDIQAAVKDGARDLLIKAAGQHGLCGRLWPLGESVHVDIEGPVGQRCGSMGFHGPELIVHGSASDDVR